MASKSDQYKVSFIVAIIVIAVIGLFFFEPIPQSPDYHQFADQRNLGFIPNAGDVLSNIFFVLVGGLGLYFGLLKTFAGGLPGLHKIYIFLFVGIFLTGFGSAYYHWSPNNNTLVWDRLPMTIGFMALFAMIIGEQVSEELAHTLVGPLIVFGAFSVAYWHFTEQQGQGDLRLYFLVQFLSLFLIAFLLLLYRSPFHSSLGIWVGLALYALAKILESLDLAIYNLGLGVSGHTLKHIAAAAAVGSVLWALRTRQPKTS